ncbi:PP2C family protein-serine/threonine phosphatase [Curtobacterium flaccumfaciens]|uniref:PP2C family protein-serine/threonine phosphatase n=1 Tax=Curtobacterium flaccumfaciens TaxID=2035 RepID=UPI0013676B5A|nr:GAF domain-containing SpoIIE family protein phosphatase [Curtobacterium flaccumfaciens]MBT1666502.1 SpoIIE family protein phosphatase [Curtobacterium flaccumfaciens pv. flaccumfaciens]QHN62995.1 SpoIIE family protein phosphatase [Curtobacterium flaccumfaciens pv. flaccumfaciens]
MQPETAMSVPATTGAHAVRRAALIAALDVVDGGVEERFERITRIAREALGVSGSFLNLAGETTLTIKSQQSDAAFGPVIPLQDTFCGRTLGEQGPVVVPDARVDARYADLPMVLGDPNVRFYAGVGLRAGDDDLKIGTLCLIDPEPRTLDADELELLQELGIWAERELLAGADEDRLRTVLNGLQPAEVQVPGYRITGMSIPHGLVSGDFHDWHRSGEDSIHLTVSDVMGKGMSAGLLAANIRGGLLARGDQDPGTAVAELEAQVAPELSRAESFATMFHGRLTPSTGRLDFADAGHGLVLQLRDDGAERILRSSDLPIGLHPAGMPRAAGSLLLRPGDVLIVVTDGALELWDSTLAALSELGSLYRESPDVETFLQRVRARVVEHDPGDDLTVVVVAREAVGALEALES